MIREKIRIIVFEDDPALGTLLKQVLIHKGYDVRIFSNPTACVVFSDHGTQCSQHSPCADIILTDHMMPNMTGIDFLKFQRMRGCKALDANKAVITGSVINKELMDTIDSLGCKIFKKPFKIAEILKWIDECAGRILKSAQP